MNNNHYFDICVNHPQTSLDIHVRRPASIGNPKDNSVLFVTDKYADQIDNLNKVEQCLVFVHESIDVCPELEQKHFIYHVKNPRLEYCRFFQSNNIQGSPASGEYYHKDGSCISKDAVIGSGTIIMPFVYIGPNVRIGENSFIGSGTRIVSPFEGGDNLVVHENVVIGAAGLACETDENGNNIVFPQFGGVKVGNNVHIFAGANVNRGTVDDTVINDNVLIGSSCIIGHNAEIGKSSVIISNSVICGSTILGQNSYIGPSCTIINKISIGDNATVGIGSVVLKPVPTHERVQGNPARKLPV